MDVRRGDLIVAVALGAVFVSAAILQYASWFVFPALRLRPTGILISAAVIGGLLRVSFRVGTFRASANKALRHLAHQVPDPGPSRGREGRTHFGPHRTIFRPQGPGGTPRGG